MNSIKKMFFNQSKLITGLNLLHRFNRTIYSLKYIGIDKFLNKKALFKEKFEKQKGKFKKVI